MRRGGFLGDKVLIFGVCFCRNEYLNSKPGRAEFGEEE